ncbi:MAG TPA: STAS domain-containing protein [Sedimenticola sp.]|nr:STAS domain-containing protein [Sedimenticola sp.]
MSATIRRGDDNNLYISGELGFATVQDLLRQGRGLLNGQGRLIIDLAGVTRTDSAGLALMLEWLGERRSCGQDICFRNVPESLLEIAQVSNLAGLLPLAEG